MMSVNSVEPICDKKQMYAILRRGVFGNSLRTWESLDDFLFDTDQYDGPMGVRCSDAPNAPFITDLSVADAIDKAHLFESQGHSVVLYEASPKKWITIQGEATVTRGYNDLWVEYTTKRKHMRAALAEERIMLCGGPAWSLLRRHLWEPSYDEMVRLFDLWPGHVVEFTAFAVAVGNFKGRNCVFWEVREY